MSITAVFIDSREPDWVKRLTFGGVPTSVTFLEEGDLWAVTDDGCTLMVERKTPDDFLNSLKDDRLFPQLCKLGEKRIDEQLSGEVKTWPYLVITGDFLKGPNGKALTPDRATGWDYSAVAGAILSIQEMGIFVVHCGGDSDYEACVLRLGNRSRKPEMRLLPPRIPNILGPAATFLASLPGIGIERVDKVLEWAGNSPAIALTGLCDLSIDLPGIPVSTRRRIRSVLGLKDKDDLEILINSIGDEVLARFDKQEFVKELTK
jgi:hypothetical protein